MAATLGRLRIDTPFAMAESGERREKEGRVEDSKADACNGNHPARVSKVYKPIL